MLEEKIDQAANGIKNGIGWIREHKKKIIGGALVGLGGIAGVGLAYKIGKNSDDDDYMCLEESEYEVTDYDPDCESDQDETETTEVEVTIEEVES